VAELGHLGCELGPQQIIDDHARCYPAANGNDRLAPLPPYMADEFLGMLVDDPDQPTGILPGDAWATDTPFHVLGLLSPDERAAEDQARETSAAAGEEPSSATQLYPEPAVTFGPQLQPVILHLIRAASTRPHLAEKQLYPLAFHYPKAVVVAGDAALDELDAIYPPLPNHVRQAIAKSRDECNLHDPKPRQRAMDALTAMANSNQPGHDESE
jgi:hypothetical protein